jgi:hypothetical protein
VSRPLCRYSSAASSVYSCRSYHSASAGRSILLRISNLLATGSDNIGSGEKSLRPAGGWRR